MFFRVPRGAFVIIREVARHLLRRPVVGVAVAARTRGDGLWLLVRRSDVGEWALPGGTLEWGETLRVCASREVAEEAGADECELVRLVGVFSRPDRDLRFHAVTVVLECLVDPPRRPPSNPLEITQVGLFAADSIPETMAMGMRDMLMAAMEAGSSVVE
jgi:8-oxo-dGTP diphosphatase